MSKSSRDLANYEFDSLENYHSAKIELKSNNFVLNAYISASTFLYQGPKFTLV